MKTKSEIDAKKKAYAIAQMIADHLSKKGNYFFVMEEKDYRKSLAGTGYENDEEFLTDVANRVPVSLKKKSIRTIPAGGELEFLAFKARKYS